ncbi:MAG: DUF1254 domain-containing protein [Thiogranum sp.]
MRKETIILFIVLFALMPVTGVAKEAVSADKAFPVNPEDYGYTAQEYAQAESTLFFSGFVNRAGINKVFTFPGLTRPGDNWVVSPNNDTIYSIAIVDTSDDVSITLPEVEEGRYMSLHVVDLNHYTPFVIYESGRHDFPKGTFDTNNVGFGIRIQANPFDPKDVQHVIELAKQIKVDAKSDKNYLKPVDKAKMLKLREALLPYYAKLKSTGQYMGKKGTVDPWGHLLVTAGAWGLFPEKDATYIPYNPKLKADRCYTATYTVPPQKEFFSITIYGPDLYLFSENAILNKYNIVFDDEQHARFTAYFGSKEQCGDVKNRLDTVDGWNLLMRAYRPEVPAIRDYKMPDVSPFVPGK